MSTGSGSLRLQLALALALGHPDGSARGSGPQPAAVSLMLQLEALRVRIIRLAVPVPVTRNLKTAPANKAVSLVPSQLEPFVLIESFCQLNPSKMLLYLLPTGSASVDYYPP